MAAITPVTTKGTAGYVDPYQGIYGGQCAANASLITNGTHLASRNGLQLFITYASAIANNNIWVSGYGGAFACAFQPNQNSADRVAPTITSSASGTITFRAPVGSQDGWVWVLANTAPRTTRTGTTTATMVTSPGTAGYVEPGNGLYGSAELVSATALITGGTHFSNRNGLRMSVWFFSSIDNGDTWASNIPGILASAWQPVQADTDQVSPRCITAREPGETTTGVIDFDAPVAGGYTGWVWVLSRG